MSSSRRTDTLPVVKATPASSSTKVKKKKKIHFLSDAGAVAAIKTLATILKRRLVKLASPKHTDLPRLRELANAWGVPYRNVVNAVTNSSDFEFKDHDACKRAVKVLLGSGKNNEEVSTRRKTLRSLMYTNTVPVDKTMDPKLKPFVEAIKEQLLEDFDSYESKVDESAASVSASTTPITPLKQVDIVTKEPSPGVSRPNPRAPPLKFEPRASTPREETNALDAECLRQRVIELEQRLEQALSDLNKARRETDDASSAS